MRLRVWTPLPPSPSGIADYASEQLSALAGRMNLQAIVEDPASVAAPPGVVLRRPGEEEDADLDLYHLGNSPAHAYVYRAALTRPGVVLLHDWSLHHLVLKETVERNDVSGYLREMRRARGEVGTFVGRQVARALGGDVLPALFPLNDRVLESSLGVVGLTGYVAGRAERRLPGRPVLHLPHHLSLPFAEPPSREDARRALGLSGPLVVAPGLLSSAKRIDVGARVVERLAGKHPGLRLLVAGGRDPRFLGDIGATEVSGRLSLEDFCLHLCAADVVFSLRFPTHGEISGALVRALGIGRPALVSAGTPASEEFPEGVVVSVDPSAAEEAEVEALLSRLLSDPDLAGAISRLARAHILEHHDLARTTETLAVFLEGVLSRKAELLSLVETPDETTLLGYLVEEVKWAARDLGLPGLSLGLEERLRELAP